MKQKLTEDLENILQNTHNGGLATYLEDNAGEMVDEAKPFSAYMHQIIKRNGLTQQDVFLAADFPERYGYKLLAEEKRTKQRDYILGICYAANMTLDETQRALALYGMGKLYGITFYSSYLHLATVDVKVNQQVKRDSTILGEIGGSGYEKDYYYDPHLHVCVYTGNPQTNPYGYCAPSPNAETMEEASNGLFDGFHYGPNETDYPRCGYVCFYDPYGVVTSNAAVIAKHPG